MDLRLKGKLALISGATAGIGLAIAQELAQEGASVAIAGRDQAKLDSAVQHLKAHCGDAAVQAILADVTTVEGTTTLFQQVPTLDILINNLGIYEPKAFVDITDEDWLRLFNINVMSGVRLTRNYLPAMMQRNWGRIIFIASESAISTPPEMIHYGMTKTAQLAIARGLAETTKGTGVTVNSVMPGPTRSEGIVEFLQKMSSSANATPEEAEAEFFQKHRSASLLQRLIEPEEIAHLVAYLASPLSAATNGAALRAEGGLLRAIA
jgi:NAD(P)-dependent dehydrogenase (short-subunit alcohol dehydrogenase family)